MTEQSNIDPVGVNSERLKSIIERIERLAEEKKGISSDIKDIYLEAKGLGYDPKALKAVIKLRSLDKSQREEMEELVDLYMSAVGD